jgi:hypothetical protein
MEPSINDTKQIFRQCGACSQTFAYLINRAYDHHDPVYEKALDPLVGGIFREGHQCGMLWGAAMATGAEAYRRTDDAFEAQAMALSAAKELVASFEDHNHTIECREITGVRMNRLSGLLKYMIQSLIAGMENNKCFVMAEEWAPKALEASKAGLQSSSTTAPRYNCAVMIAKMLEASDEEATMVAGFAGGIGLSGKGCGALAAAIWLKTLAWLKQHPGKSAPMFRFPEVSQLINGFKQQTNDCLRCEEICHQKFNSAEAHSAYLEYGGCGPLLQWLKTA